MYVTITDDRTSEILMQRELADDDVLDCDIYAKEYAELYCIEVAEKDGHCPIGCADFTVELADEPLSAVCWTAESYFYA